MARLTRAEGLDVAETGTLGATEDTDPAWLAENRARHGGPPWYVHEREAADGRVELLVGPAWDGLDPLDEPPPEAA